MRRPPNIQTEHVVLVALLAEEYEALIAGAIERFATLTGFRFPSDDPNIGDLSWHLRAIQADDRQIPWRIRAIVERSSNTVVGSINLKGPPDDGGDVEIGYGLIESVRRRGYATEASAAVITWAVQQPGVATVSATIPDDNYPHKVSPKDWDRFARTRLVETLPLWKRDGKSVASISG